MLASTVTRPGECRGPNIPLPNCCRDGFSICSWNARGLAHHKPHIQKQKVFEVSLLSKRFDIIVIEEAHGNDDLFRQILRVPLRSHKLFCSFCLNPEGDTKSDAGGIVVLIKKRICDGSRMSVFEPGRLLEIYIPLINQGALSLFAAHNYGITRGAMANFERRLGESNHNAKVTPDKFCSVLIGDFNLTPTGTHPIFLKAPLAPWARDSSDASDGQVRKFQPDRLRWEQIFGAMVETFPHAQPC